MPYYSWIRQRAICVHTYFFKNGLNARACSELARITIFLTTVQLLKTVWQVSSKYSVLWSVEIKVFSPDAPYTTIMSASYSDYYKVYSVLQIDLGSFYYNKNRLRDVVM